MPSTLSSRRMSAREIESYAQSYSHSPSSRVELPNFHRARSADKVHSAGQPASSAGAASASGTTHGSAAQRQKSSTGGAR
jgi:hypothetical protein